MTFKGAPYYWGAIATSKCLKAILFAFLPGKNRDKATLDACTGWVRHMGRFYESRTYTFVLDAQLTKGDAEVLLLDQKEQPLLKMRDGYVAVSAAKNHFSIHFSDEEFLNRLAESLPACKKGKRCINIKYGDAQSLRAVEESITNFLKIYGSEGSPSQ